MTTIENFGDSQVPLPRDAHYEVSMAVYNENTKKWEPATEPVGKKTSAFMENSAVKELLAAHSPGEILAFTEKGIYKKTDRGWIQELSGPATREKYPEIAKTLRSLSSVLPASSAGSSQISPDLLESVETKAIIQVSVKAEHEDVTGLVREIEGRHPGLAHELLEQHNEKALNCAIEAGHTALVADKCIEKIQQPAPALKRIGLGQAKQVFLRREKPEFAYLTPVTGAMEMITGAKENEIKQEVNTAKKIAFNLFRSDLLAFLKAKKFTYPDRVAEHLSAKYSNFTDLKAALKTQQASQFANFTKITSMDAEALVGFVDAMPEGGVSHLAVDLTEVAGEEMIEGRYTVRTTKASGDLEKEIRKPALDFGAKVGFVSDLFAGMEDLHRAGFVHGDLKPENLLVYEQDGNKNAKLSDFGKTRPLAEGATAFYSGNGRYCSPERKLSRKSEVYSSALIAIRVLEEGYLNEESGMLLSPAEKDTIEPEKSRRGVEKFAVMNKHMPQVESSLAGKVRAYGPGFMGGNVDLNEAEGQIHAYIDVLTESIALKEGIPGSRLMSLNGLLKEMTQSEPESRPTMNEVKRRFDEIGLP